MTLTNTKAEPVFIALSSFGSTGTDHPFLVRAGDRLRGSHPLVKRYPAKFVADGLSDAEVATIRAERRPAPPPPDEPVRPITRQIPVARRWIVKDDFTLGGHGQVFRRGQAFDMDDEVVKSAPDYFTPAIPKE